LSPDVAVPLGAVAAATDERVGPKAATLARLRAAGLPVPDGVALTAEAYRRQLRLAGLADTARQAAAAEGFEARRLTLAIRLGLTRVALDPAVAAALDAAWCALAAGGAPVAARSSALCENTTAASFAGQFDSFLGIAEPADLETAVRACWAALWSARALRYMRAYGIDPERSAMPVLLQRLVPAEAAGGAFSLTHDDRVVINGAWGLGPSIAQGDVVPDRFLLRRDATLEAIEPGRKDHLVMSEGAGTRSRPVARERVETPCLDAAEASALARLVLRVEEVLGAPVEIEWAKDAGGLWVLQARPLRLEPRGTTDDVWTRHPALTGQPAGLGRGTGPARLVVHEHDLEHVRPGDVLVTGVAGPALMAVMTRVAGVVAELGGSTSHLAALARERGIPAVLGARGATRRIPEGATVAVDGVTGLVRWVA
jgi:pyruvate,water dikinase